MSTCIHPLRPSASGPHTFWKRAAAVAVVVAVWAITSIIQYHICCQKPRLEPGQARAKPAGGPLAWPILLEGRSHVKPGQSWGFWAKLGQAHPYPCCTSIIIKFPMRCCQCCGFSRQLNSDDHVWIHASLL